MSRLSGVVREWKVQPSFLARNSLNLIRTVIEEIPINPNPSMRYISLSVGDPTVFGNLSPPESVLQAVREAIDSDNSRGYAPSVGILEARQAVAEFSKHQGPISAEDVILCSGCAHAVELTVTALADSGQNILVPAPGHMVYKTVAEGLGIELKYYKLLPEQQWKVDLDDLISKIDDDTAVIVIINPSNPCGSVYDKDHLNEILNIASRHHLPILADEIYEQFVFSGQEFTPLSSLSEDVPIITCSGISKRFLIPGWRIGWLIVHDRQNILKKEFHEGVINLSRRILGPNLLIQRALPKILNSSQSYFQDMMHFMEQQAKTACEELRRVHGLCPVMPQGAMYMLIEIKMMCFPTFKDELQFIERLVAEQAVLCLPGQCFGYPNFFRIVLTVPEDVLKEACTRITTFCNDYFVAQKENTDFEKNVITAMNEFSEKTLSRAG